MVGRNTPFFKRSSKEGIHLKNIEPNQPNENYGENRVGKAHLGDSNIMVIKQVHLQPWCYALEYYCDLSTMIVPGMLRNKVRTGYEIIFRNTPYISEYVEF